MIERDDAAVHLQPLAEPVLAAFTEAQTHHTNAIEATALTRERCGRHVLALLDGVNFWGPFACFLDDHLGGLRNVERDRTGHPLRHVWNVGDELRIQLKSDVAAIAAEQMMLPGMSALPRAGRETIAITWEHALEQRYEPAFVHLHGGREMWRIPVASLRDFGDGDATVAKIPPPMPPRPGVSSKRRPDEQRDSGTE